MGEPFNVLVPVGTDANAWVPGPGTTAAACAPTGACGQSLGKVYPGRVARAANLANLAVEFALAATTALPLNEFGDLPYRIVYSAPAWEFTHLAAALLKARSPSLGWVADFRFPSHRPPDLGTEAFDMQGWPDHERWPALRDEISRAAGIPRGKRIDGAGFAGWLANATKRMATHVILPRPKSEGVGSVG
jgi:hypothetical protein